ncbi:O-antigen ligase family protein [Variovorax paradoxus]|uniref:O-antigen ligase family protein n=1 Tax=Variovorax paradoxus TaxID=34073 RepID=UPI0027836A1E|nr:O-antigen ligase family protein [Variovorax paradoxus]MDP9929197.1 O-antigen ligase [Variovorax paradoxus]
MKHLDTLATRSAALMMAATAFSASWGVTILIEGISLFRTLAFATLAILIYDALRKRRMAKLESVEISIALLWIWCLLSLLWSLDSALSSAQIFGTSLLAFLVFIATLRLSLSPKYWKSVGLFYVLGCVVASLIVLTSAVSFATGGQGDDRATVGELNANYIAYAIATSIAMALTLHNYQPQRWFVKLATVLYVPLAMSAILLTGSRGAMMAGGASVLLYFLLSIKRQFISSVASIALAFAGIYFLFDYLPDSVRDRMEFFTEAIFQSSDAVDLSGREYVWPLATQLFFENMFSGIGFGAFRAANGDGISVHNAILTMAAETGLPGVILFSFTVLAVFWRTIFKSANPEVRKGGFLLLVTWVPIAMTGVWEASAVAWMAFGWYFGASKHPYEPPEQLDGKRQRRLRIQW